MLLVALHRNVCSQAVNSIPYLHTCQKQALGAVRLGSVVVQ